MTISAINAAVTPGATPSDLSAEKVKTLAVQFESLLIAKMLKDMQQPMFSEEGEGLSFGGPLAETVMAELAGALAKAGGMGLSKELARAMQRSTPEAGPAEVAPAPYAPVRDLPAASIPPSGSAPLSYAPLSVEPSAASVRLIDPAQVSSAYGWRRDPFSGASKFHKGIDVPLGHGDDVRSVRSGTIVDASNRTGYGLTVVVDHGGGVQSRYAHLSALHVRVGDRVADGQLVGSAGRTGRATGTHLHFEVLADGKSVDPMGQEAAGLLGGRPVTEVFGRPADYVVVESPTPGNPEPRGNHENH